MAITRSISWFTLIGASAATVHYVVAVGLEAGMHIAPAWANPCGFLLAFPVSYIGHGKLSFAGHDATHAKAFPKFLLVACSGFFANQFLLLSLLELFAIPFWLALAIVMFIVATTTYILSRYWAFK